MTANKTCRVLLAGLLLLAGLDNALAHSRSLSYSHWEIGEQGARVSARISQLELTRAGLYPDAAKYRQRVADLLTTKLALHDRAGPCRPRAATLPILRGAEVVHRWRVNCHNGPPTALHSALLYDRVTSHLHFASLRLDDAQTRERVLSAADPNWTFGGADPAAATASGFADYLQLGVEHILGGWDHLAFLLTLLVLATSLGELALLVTGFTAAHSLTLAAAVLGWVQPAAGAVEIFIALSIVLVAVENVWRMERGGIALPAAVVAGLLLLALLPVQAPAGMLVGLALFAGCYFVLSANSSRPHYWRLAITFAFGLFHGFGFAGVLADLQLPAERLAPALLGFNLGVEAGQIALLLLAWPIVSVLRRRGLPAREAISAGAAAMGIYWLVLRIAS